MENVANGGLWAPAEITPAQTGTEPSARGLRHTSAHRDDLGALLAEEKALVFRGFGIEPASWRGVDLLLPNRLAYVHGNSPRTKVAPTSTPRRSTRRVQHLDAQRAAVTPTSGRPGCSSTASRAAEPEARRRWWTAPLARRRSTPRCARPSRTASGTARTCTTDGLRQELAGHLRDRRRGRVEEFLGDSGADWEWRPDGSLQVTQLRPAITTHPVTGDEVWFNQADQWHPASLGDETAKALASIMPADELPQSVSFADGHPSRTPTSSRSATGAWPTPWTSTGARGPAAHRQRPGGPRPPAVHRTAPGARRDVRLTD